MKTTESLVNLFNLCFIPSFILFLCQKDEEVKILLEDEMERWSGEEMERSRDGEIKI